MEIKSKSSWVGIIECWFKFQTWIQFLSIRLNFANKNWVLINKIWKHEVWVLLWCKILCTFAMSLEKALTFCVIIVIIIIIFIIVVNVAFAICIWMWLWWSHIDKAKPQLHPIQGLIWTCQVQLDTCMAQELRFQRET